MGDMSLLRQPFGLHLSAHEVMFTLSEAIVFNIEAKRSGSVSVLCPRARCKLGQFQFELEKKET